jgi:uncharacterized membrane protein HdeD (DUF308 family)
MKLLFCLRPLLEGIAGIILGLLLITDPDATVVALVTFLGFYWLIMGILALVRISSTGPSHGYGRSSSASSAFWPESLF